MPAPVLASLPAGPPDGARVRLFFAFCVILGLYLYFARRNGYGPVGLRSYPSLNPVMVRVKLPA